MAAAQPLFGRQAGSESQPDAPGALAAQKQEQGKIAQIQSQYAKMCGCTSCSPTDKADDVLKRVKAESYAHILGHEQAHQSAAGGFGGGIHIQYDSNGVAIAGHVPISIPGLDPQSPESSMKAYGTIRGAALAPSDPSGQDMAVASQAQALMGRAQVLMSQKKQAQALGLTPEEFKKAGTPAGKSADK